MLMTIKEFAQTLKMTPQAVYRRLNTDLKPYVQKEAGKIMIESAAYDLFKDRFEKQVSEPVNELNTDTMKIMELQHQIDLLTVQLKASEEKTADRDTIITELRNQITALNQHIESQSAVITTLTDQLQKRTFGNWLRGLLPGKKTEE